MLISSCVHFERHHELFGLVFLQYDL